MLILEGIPLFLIELGIGQRMRLGSLGVWNTIHPWLGGIGISSCVVTLFVAIYYNVIITWCIFYFVNSFRVSLTATAFLHFTLDCHFDFSHSRFLCHGLHVQNLMALLLKNVHAHRRRNTFGIVPHSTRVQASTTMAASSGGSSFASSSHGSWCSSSS